MTNPNANQLYIKVYINDLVTLIREHNLTRAQVGELLILSTFMNADNTAFPGRGASSYRAGKKSVKWTRQMQQNIASKEALGLYADENRQRYGFELPACFEFGPPRAFRSSRSPQPPPSAAPAHVPANPAPDTRATLGKPPGAPPTQWTPTAPGEAGLLRRMVQAGVGDVEAYLMIQQYDHALIVEKLDRAAGKDDLKNRGSYVRVGVERAAHSTLKYPATTRETLKMQAAHALKAAHALAEPTGHRLTSDPFYRDPNGEE